MSEYNFVSKNEQLNFIAPKNEKLLSLTCPICNKNFTTTEVELDKHVDECLSGTFFQALYNSEWVH